MLSKKESPFIFIILGILIIIITHLKDAVAQPINYYEGEINEDFVEFIEKQPVNSTIKINSIGGNAVDAFDAAKTIKQKNISAQIDGVCISACVDFLFPAFRKIEITNRAVVAMHGNTHFSYYEGIAQLQKLKRKYPIGYYDACRRRTAKLEAFWKENGVNIEAITRGTKQLEIESVEINNMTCPDISFKIKFFVPNKRQLEEIFGKKFKGELCADVTSCINERIVERRKDTPLIVVNQKYNIPTKN